jgi:hypothetical protein
MCRGMSGSNSRDDQTGSFGEGSHQQIEVEIIAVECMAMYFAVLESFVCCSFQSSSTTKTRPGG